MVDREARDKAAVIVRHFIAGQMFNFDFQDSQPTSDDPVVEAIWDSLWPFYCDLRKHKMRDEWAISAETKHQLARWLLFLYGNYEYLWPKISYPGVRPIRYGPFSKLLGFDNKQKKFLCSGDYEVWPFISTGSFVEAKKCPKLMGGTQ